MNIYVKPSGQKVEVNDRSCAAAEKLGWEKKEPKPKGRPKKEKEAE